MTSTSTGAWHARPRAHTRAPRPGGSLHAPARRRPLTPPALFSPLLRAAPPPPHHSHVILPKELAKTLQPKRLLAEAEWRALGVQQSRGWAHYAIHRPEPHILLFRRELGTDPMTGKVSAREMQGRERARRDVGAGAGTAAVRCALCAHATRSLALTPLHPTFSRRRSTPRSASRHKTSTMLSLRPSERDGARAAAVATARAAAPEPATLPSSLCAALWKRARDRRRGTDGQRCAPRARGGRGHFARARRARFSLRIVG